MAGPLLGAGLRRTDAVGQTTSSSSSGAFGAGRASFADDLLAEPLPPDALHSLADSDGWTGTVTVRHQDGRHVEVRIEAHTRS